MKTIICHVIAFAFGLVTCADPTLAQSERGSYSWSSSRSSASSWSWHGDNRPPRTNSTQNLVVANGRKSLSMQDLPLISALELVAKTGPAKIRVSEGARRAILTATRTVSMTSRDESQEQLLRQLLAGTGVRVVQTKNAIELIAHEEEGHDLQFVSIRRVAVESALRREITLNMDRVPVQMALQMIEGFIGVRVTYESAKDGWLMQGPMVIIHADGESASELLNSIARQTGREVRVRDDRVELAEPSA